ncbi:MAG: metal ABC transporter permease [Pirellula sp.]|jgi:manganese/zinc/iron transport system permease protein|nr:metal ABC transporter permease [Pirellula sp.]
MFDFNTRLVTFSSGILGCLAGAVGVYLLLRRKSLIGDTICHAALPGIALSFLVQVVAGGNGKNLLMLLLGAAISGGLGSLSVMALGRFTKLKPDAILGIVLSVFFGFGMVLFSIVQQMPDGNAAGLENFILGKTASIVTLDFHMIWIATALVLTLLVLFRKELQLLCFDSSFAASNGWPVAWLDLLLMASVLLVVIVGANVVGVILVVALMVIPPVCSRFWTEQLGRTVWLSASIGGLSGIFGSLSSLWFERLPTGPSIVLSATAFFVLSFLFGTQKGILWKAWSHYMAQRRADSEHLLRGVFEVLEARGAAPQAHGQTRSEAVSPSALIQMRSWGERRLRRAVDSICRSGLGNRNSQGDIVLTARGIQESFKAVRRHRLLEIYFSNLADLSPTALDRGADMLEHALDDDMLARLEGEFLPMENAIRVPASVHPI